MTIADSTVTLTNGLTLSYGERAGDPGLAVVFLPGPMDSWRSYAPVLDALDPSVHAIAVSARGHGDSDRPPHGYGITELAEDLVLVLDALDLDRAVLAGHSGSCFAVRRVAIDQPGRVAGLVLESSPSTLQDHAALAELVAEVETLTDPVDPAFVRTFVTGTSSDTVPPQLLDLLVAEAAKIPAVVWRELLVSLQEYDDLDRLSGVVAPALLVWGDADLLVTQDMQAELADRLPTSALLAYPGIGHTPRWEQPARFAEDVGEFVTRDLGRR